MKKTIIYLVILTLVIGVGIAVGLNMEDDKKAVETMSGKTENKVNQVQNNQENKIENTINNNVVENTTNNKIQEGEEIEEESQEQGAEDKNGEPKTDLEKAIDLVKKDWGEDSSVKFVEDGKTNTGEYIICVRDKNTTNALAWYKVNLENETCEQW